MPQLKLCSKCNKTLSVTHFSWKKINKLRSSHCKDCSKKSVNRHYRKNTAYYLAKAKRRNNSIKRMLRKYVAKYLHKHPCVDCGEDDLLVLEFDHIEREKKSYNISAIIKNSMSLQTLKAEIAKCHVRCANCHRRKSEVEADSWKLQYMRL